MIFGGRRRANTDIYPTIDLGFAYPPPWTKLPSGSRNLVPSPCPTPQTSPLHFLNLPSEIRRLIFHEYFLSLNLPDQLFHHLTFLGYWGSSLGSDTTQKDPRGFDLGRRIRREVECLFLVNRQVHIEAEEVLYSSFIFYVHPRHQSLSLRQALYDRKENIRVGPRPPRLSEKVKNIQINIAFGQSTSSLQWASREGWRGSWFFLASKFPNLRKVGLAIDYDPRSGDEESIKQLMQMVVYFVRIFRRTCFVYVRFAGVNYDQYASLSPASPPLYAEILDEEKRLLELRDEKKFIWHKVAKHFNDPRSELYSVAGLQARYERLKLRQVQAGMEVVFLQNLQYTLRQTPEELDDSIVVEDGFMEH